MPNSIPDARRLADLLDGRLGAAERERLLGELAASDDALDVYADAVVALAELERAGVTPQPVPVPAPSLVPVKPPWDPGSGRQPAPVLPHVNKGERLRAPVWRRAPRWAAIAAGVAVVGLGSGLWWRAHPASGGEGDDGAAYVAALDPGTRAAGLPAGWNGTPWRVTRGTGDGLTPEARAVRVGARATDLELAAGARDIAAVRAVSAEVAALLDGVPAAGATALTYRAFGTAAVPAAPALADARRDAALLAGEDDVALGTWLEAARVAAARRDVGFFRKPASRTAAGRLRRATAVGNAELTNAAEAVAALLNGSPNGRAEWQPAEWQRLEDALTAALRELGG